MRMNCDKCKIPTPLHTLIALYADNVEIGLDIYDDLLNDIIAFSSLLIHLKMQMFN